MELLKNFSKETEVNFELPQGERSSTATVLMKTKTLKIKDSDYDSEVGFESYETDKTYFMTEKEKEEEK